MISLLRKYYPYLVITLIALILMCIWFKDGYYLGGGDVGLPFYNPLRTLNTARYLWWENVAPGFTYAQTLSSLPLYMLLSVIQKVLITSFRIQFFFNFFILAFAGISLYLLSGELLETKNKVWRLFTVGSYIFSAYMMDSVWHRAVYTTIIFAAVLPFTLWLFIKLAQTSKFRYFIWLQFVLFMFSYLFGTFSHVITLWSTLALFVVLNLIIYGTRRNNASLKSSLFRSSKNKLRAVIYWYGASVVLWGVLNVWWILPQFKVSEAVFTQFTSLDSNLQTLLLLSNKLPIQYVIRGLNLTYFWDENVWGSIYLHPLFFILSWIPIIIILFGFLLNKSNKSFLFFLSIWLLVIFFAKGTAPPLGGIFRYLFTTSFIIGVYRNAFEKIGVLIPLFGAFLVTISWQNIAEKLSSRAFKILVGLYVLLYWFIFLWPMWTGDVFGEKFSRDIINPPSSYNQVNALISQDIGNYRALHLPLTSGGVTYNWNPNYRGIDPVHGLFDHPVISNSFGIKHIDAILSNLSTKLNNDRPNDSLLSVMKVLSVKYVVLHSDINWQERELTQVSTIRQNLKSLNYLKLVLVTDELEVYKIDDSHLQPKLYSYDRPLQLSPDLLVGNEKLWEFENDNASDIQVYVSGVKNTNLENLPIGLLLPIAEISFSDSPIVHPENAIRELAYVRYLPDSPLYSLVRLKESLVTLETAPNGILSRKVDLAGKRVVEVYHLVKKGNYQKAKEVLNEYDMNINEILPFVSENGYILPSVIRHYHVLEVANTLRGDNHFISDYMQTFTEKLVKARILPKYSLGKGFEIFDKKIYRFEVPTKADYELLIELPPNTQDEDLKTLKQIAIFVDGEHYQTIAKKENGYLSLGTKVFESGIHEIAYTPLHSANLIDASEGGEYILNSDFGDNLVKTIEIKGFAPSSDYFVSFEYSSLSGCGGEYRIVQDSDPVINGIRQYAYKVGYGNKLCTSDNDWNDTSFIFNSRKNALQGFLEFALDSWDKCSEDKKNERSCSFAQDQVNMFPTVKIRNLKLQRIYSPKVALKNTGAASAANGNFMPIEFIKVNPTNYKFSINIDTPTLLVFSESYHNMWKLYLNGKQVDETQHHIANLYANSWYINAPGDFEAEIIFLPQKSFNNYIAISLFSGVVLLLLTLVISRKYII